MVGARLCSASRGPSLRTQVRPAIEYVSGEEGLRPKSYFLVSSFVEYVFMDTQNYVKAPGSLFWSRGEEGAVLLWHRSFREQCLVSLLPVT